MQLANSVKLRNHDRFDEELTAELRAKYPNIYKDPIPLPYSLDELEMDGDLEEEQDEQDKEEDGPQEVQT